MNEGSPRRNSRFLLRPAAFVQTDYFAIQYQSVVGKKIADSQRGERKPFVLGGEWASLAPAGSARRRQAVAAAHHLFQLFQPQPALLEKFDPVNLVNQFHWMNPEIPLNNLMKQSPLKVFEAVVKFLTISDGGVTAKNFTSWRRTTRF